MMQSGGRLSDYRITRFEFERDRPIGDSQLRITSKPINADEMLALIKELLAS